MKGQPGKDRRRNQWWGMGWQAIHEYRTCLQKAGEALEAGKPGDCRYYIAGAWDSLRDIEREMFPRRVLEYSVFWRQATTFLGRARQAADAGDLGAARTNLAAASWLGEELRAQAAGWFRQDPAPRILDVLAANPPGGTLRLADIARSVEEARPADVAEALRRLVRAGMVRALPGMHRALSEKNRRVWAMGYEITDLGRRAREGLVPVPPPAYREHKGMSR